MEDLQLVENWKDKILGDLKEFSSKKHKPVGMHHLIQEINKLANPGNLIEIGFTELKKDFIKENRIKNIKLNDKIKNNPIFKKLADNITAFQENKNNFNSNAKSIIIYAIPIPKGVFKYSLKDIYEYFNILQNERKKIDYLIINALAKYGYWGIPEENQKEYGFKNFNKNKIFLSSHLGEIAPNGFPITSKNGPRIYLSYIITDAPLKVQNDRPINLCNEECQKLALTPTLKHLKYYKNTFGYYKTLTDSLTSIIKDNKFGQYIDFCFNCQIGKEYEINLLVKNPLDYKN